MIKMCTIATVPSTIKAFLGDQLVFLQKNRFVSTIITSPQSGSQNIDKPLPENIKVEYVEMIRTVQPLQDFKAFCSIYKILRREKFDIVQYVTPKAALIGSIASWLARVPARLYLMWGLYYVTQVGLKRIFFKSLEKINCMLSTSITPDSRGNLNIAIKERLCTSRKIRVIGHGSANGVDIQRFNPKELKVFGKEVRARYEIPDDAFVYGTIAAIVADKGINELIISFKKLAQKYSNIYLLYIGQTTEKDPVESETLETIRSHRRIIHLEWQAEPEKYFAAMNAFVLPTYREGFGVVNIEASAMELPVISTDVPGPQESIIHKQTGLLVPAKEVEPLTKAMEELIKKPDVAVKLGKEGRKRVVECYEQKKLWNEILEHRRMLLKAAGKLPS